MTREIELASSAHATMALGVLSAMIEDEAAAKYVPGPPRLLELWGEAVEATRDAALRELGARARSAIGVVQPGRALASVMPLDETNPGRLREMGVEEVARGAIEALVEALDREGCKLAEPDVMQRAAAAAVREVVDGERATQEINAAAPAGPDLSLYVVCTNPPGPGAAALIGEEIDKVRARVRNGEIDSDVGDELVAAALRGAQRACEFVELEDADGASRGDSVGARWEEHGEAWRLGPFSRAAVLEEAPR